MNKRNRAILLYTDAANAMPAETVVAEGESLHAVEKAAVSIYTTLLADKIGLGRTVGSVNDRVAHHAANTLRGFQITVLDAEDTVALTLGASPDE